MNKFVFSIFALFLLALSSVIAGELTATSVIIDGAPGETVSGTTRVRNNLGMGLEDLEIITARLIGESDPSQKIPRDMITVRPQVFDLDNGEVKIVTVTIEIPEDLDPQTYSGEFRVVGDNQDVPFDVIVTVRERGPQPSFNFNQIEVDGVDVLGTNQNIHVERDSTVEIRSEFMSNIHSDRVRVKAWIGGFEFGDVSDRTGIFTVELGIVYSKTLLLKIPNDIELDEEDFRLHVEIFDNEGVSREETFRLAIRKERHSLNLLDVIFFPSDTVEAGRSLRAEVRVENLGERKEEDILVKASIPKLGVSARDFIEELVSSEGDTDDDDEETSGSAELMLLIPKNAKSGEYEVEISVEFNRGHDVISEKRTILVEGAKAAVIVPAEAIISVDATSQNIVQGSEIPYRIMLANLGDERVVYSLQVSGTEGWATTRLSSAFVSVDSNAAGEVVLYVKANEDASLGGRTFNVKIMSNGEEVKQLTLNANIVSRTVAPTRFEDLQRGLLVGFVILVIILIILGLVIAFRRVSERSAAEEPETVEGQTYY